jgi:1-aminocyclopropane-1-carboxylate deaminase/D-cysteine desulfhydrase-like pyridoxal-dependent ACC family enzyme
MSPQLNIVAQISKKLGVSCKAFVPATKQPDTPEMAAARQAGMEIVPVPAGYNSVIIARARQAAFESGWREIPFGMECAEAVEATRAQVANIPDNIRQIVVPVGSGMSLAGILHGMKDFNINHPVLGVVCGADPTRRLNTWAPLFWQSLPVKLISAGLDYHKPAPVTTIEGLALDPIYEAKCLPFLQSHDLLWIVGIRQTASTP